MLILYILPLYNTIISGLFGRWLGKQGVKWISLLTITIAVIVSLQIYQEVAIKHNLKKITLINWFQIDFFEIQWSFYFDTLTVVILLVVIIISWLVHIYSIHYIELDPHLPRFISYLSLFTWFILILISGENFLVLFVGWEGVGLCSFLLISFWFTRIYASTSALKAIIMNRVSDWGITIGILFIFYLFGTLNFQITITSIPFFSNFYIPFLVCFLFIGAIGKSAQLWLHTWLPDAIEGPTPVSALIHAATIVTAGVYLLLRCHYFLEYIPTILAIIALWGGLTSIFAASTGLVQIDIKKVIAYSTCSQLGYIIIACGLSQYSLSIFHLINHAALKALLFLGAGSVIHALQDQQDIRRIGNLIQYLPITYISILIGSLAITGIPFLTGYYSKDPLLENTLQLGFYSIKTLFLYSIALLTAFLTAWYSIRLIFITFYSTKRYTQKIQEKIHESKNWITWPLICLSMLSIWSGYWIHKKFLEPGTYWNGLFPNSTIFIHLETETLFFLYKILPVIGSSIMIIYGIKYYLENQNLINQKWQKFYVFLTNSWNFDILYNQFIVQTIWNWSLFKTYFYLDRGLLEKLGPFGMKNSIQYIIQNWSRIHTGSVYHSILIIWVSAILILYITIQNIQISGFISLLVFYFNQKKWQK